MKAANIQIKEPEDFVLVISSTNKSTEIPIEIEVTRDQLESLYYDIRDTIG